MDSRPATKLPDRVPIFAKHILATKPEGKIGVLYQNDGFGKDYLIGLKEGLGAAHAGW